VATRIASEGAPPPSLADLVRADLPEGQVEWALTRLLQWSLRGEVQRRVLEASPVQMTPALSHTLAQVVQDGPLRLSDLAERLAIDASTLTPRVQQLAAAGLVRRVCDPRDGRAAQLEATEVGRSAFAALHAARRRLVEQALAGLSPPQRQAVARQLASLTDRLTACPFGDEGPGCRPGSGRR
jgi:DNA-binding MarR family transcriptional regulator